MGDHASEFGPIAFDFNERPAKLGLQGQGVGEQAWLQRDPPAGECLVSFGSA